MAKLQGLARYAALHADSFRRVEAVAEVNGKLRALDMTRTDVREALEGALSVRDLYAGALGKNYPDNTPVKAH